MADYAIGDVQGCYEPLQRLLTYIDFNEREDTLWFVGDLVNRGPQSLQVLRFIKSLPHSKVTLGNHDLHLLCRIFTEDLWRDPADSLIDILQAPDAEELGHWLRKQSIICYSPELKVAMCHAGIAPFWDLRQALTRGAELEAVLQGAQFRDFLNQMYGNEPRCWSDNLSGHDRLRVITNYFTRMRFCDTQGCLDFDYKGEIALKPAHCYPWFALPDRKSLDVDLVFGHWAALMGICPYPRLHAIDTGCFWGGQLTALRLQDKQRFSVSGQH